MKKNLQKMGANQLTRNAQRKITGRVGNLYKCSTNGDCFPSAFQCGKGCPGGVSRCSLVSAALCP
jgi:hypothetical protein